MSAQWQQLNPLSHSSFLLVDGAGVGHDILIDMGHRGASLDAVLRAHGSNIDRIAHLLVTHIHPDHLLAETAADMAAAGTTVYVGEEAWSLVGDRPGCGLLEASGRLQLLPPAGTGTIAGHSMTWATFPHGTPNTAFRIGDQLFSGDAPTSALLNTTDPVAANLFGIGGGSTRGLWINTAQRSRADIHANAEELGPRRVHNYLTNHGIAEDVVAAIGNPVLQGFFTELQFIVPHHLRRTPLVATARWIRTQLVAARDSYGFSFRIEFPGAEL
jgi:hypothetical protein